MLLLYLHGDAEEQGGSESRLNGLRPNVNHRSVMEEEARERVDEVGDTGCGRYHVGS